MEASMDQNKISNASQVIIEVSREIESCDMSLSKLCLFVSDRLLEISESLPSREGVVHFVKDGEQPEDIINDNI